MGYQKKPTSMALSFSRFRENIWKAMLVTLTITTLIFAFTFTAQANPNKDTPASGNATQTAVDAPGHSDFVKSGEDTSPNYWPGEDSASPLADSSEEGLLESGGWMKIMENDDVEPNFHKGQGKRLENAGRKTVTGNEKESSADQGLQ